jgi:hypothetical protein
MLKRASLPIAILAVAGLAACNGGGSTTVVGPTPGPTCGPLVTSQLVYPAPGATAVPDALAQIVIAVSAPLAANTYNLALIAQSSGGTAFTYYPLAQISASQLPAGSATTTIPNPTYEAVNLINPLPAATTIQTAINNPSDPNNCTPQTVPGTFTTQ